MKSIKNSYLKTILIIILIFLFIFALFFDISLSTNNFPVLTTILFLLFISFRFFKLYIR